MKLDAFSYSHLDGGVRKKIVRLEGLRTSTSDMGPAFILSPLAISGLRCPLKTSGWTINHCVNRRLSENHETPNGYRRMVPRRIETSACHESGREMRLSGRSIDTAEDVVRVFWDFTKSGSFSDTVNLFTDDALYHDMLYASPFRGRKAILSHLKDMEAILATGVVLVLDDIVAGELTAAARWHAETPNGGRIPLSQGLSMYTLVHGDTKRSNDNTDIGQASSGLLISEAWDFVETPFKVASIILPVLRSASWILSRFRPEKKTKSQS